MILNGIIHSGRIYSDKEFDAGEKVAVAFDVHHINMGNNPFMESMLSRDEKWVILGNEKYKVIGWGSTGVDAPYIPITSVPGDTILEGGIQIDFKHALTNQEKDELTRLCNTELNGLFSVPQIHTLNLDQIYLYNTIIAICVLIIVCSGLNFALIYRYILMTRRKSGLCGRVSDAYAAGLFSDSTGISKRFAGTEKILLLYEQSLSHGSI